MQPVRLSGCAVELLESRRMRTVTVNEWSGDIGWEIAITSDAMNDNISITVSNFSMQAEWNAAAAGPEWTSTYTPTSYRRLTVRGGGGTDQIDLSAIAAASLDPQIIIELLGGDGQDLIKGSGAADKISGDSGYCDPPGTVNKADIIYGNGGNDVIRGDHGSDTIYGGDGDDLLIGDLDQECDNKHNYPSYNDSLYGGDGTDSLFGGDGADRLFGNVGNDLLVGNAHNDYIDGGENDDDLHGESGADVLFGRGGHDDLFGNDGNDQLYGDDHPSNDMGSQGTDYLYGDSGLDVMFGGPWGDLLEGGSESDLIVGNAGHDLIRGEGGNDILWGDDDINSLASGDDSIYGDDGCDDLHGGLGVDRGFGGANLDSIAVDIENPFQEGTESCAGAGQQNVQQDSELGSYINVGGKLISMEFLLDVKNFRNWTVEEYLVVRGFDRSDVAIALEGIEKWQARRNNKWV